MNRRHLSADLWALVLLAGTVIACFWRIALAGRVLAGGDILTYFYPYWAEATQALRAGRLPLWNPYLFLGAPFLANSQVGFFYPLNWPLWLLWPPHRSVHLSIVLHLMLAAFNGYAWGRCSLHMGRWGAWTLGMAFALGGYLGAQVEHLNQLQGLAWLPLALLIWDRGWRATGGLALLFGLVLLAGHMQTAFILFVGVGLYGLSTVVSDEDRGHRWSVLGRRAGHALARLAVAGVVGGALAAVQLVPSWELSRLSIRAGGLPFNERLSFSLSPLYLGRALLPGFDEPVPPQHIEHVAYIGVVGMMLALLGLDSLVVERLPRRWRGVLAMLLTGLFLSPGLYNPVYVLLATFVPGFTDFRVPARWLALYALGIAALAGYGIEALRARRPIARRSALLCITVPLLLAMWAVAGTRLGSAWQVGRLTGISWAIGIAAAAALLLADRHTPGVAVYGLVTLLGVELFMAAAALPHTRATAPQAFTELRPAIAHLLAAGNRETPAPRFLSISDLTFDPGDLPEIRLLYGPQLSPPALYDYIIAAKQKEVLSPNLPLAFGIPAVDGYDGGLLPLARYVMFQRVLLGGDEGSIDGRLREQLAAVPEVRWLKLCHVRYLITDKLRDAWLDGVFYDLQFRATLEHGEASSVAHIPPFKATALGLVSYLEGGASLAQGTPVGMVEIGWEGGLTHTFELRAGEHTAEGLYGPHVAHSQAQVGGHFWSGEPRGNDYVTRLRWPSPAVPRSITVRATLPEGRLVIRGISLVDERTGSFQSLVLSEQGRWRLVHSGDVKVYENLEVLPRAFLVHRARISGESDESTLQQLSAEAFDPAREVLLTDGEALDLPPPQEMESVTVRRYTPEQIALEVRAARPGYLVLSDAWYPGWEARIDGQRVPIRRANLLFRAIAVDAGVHTVEFTFRPRSVLIGLVISLAGSAALLAAALAAYRKGAAAQPQRPPGAGPSAQPGAIEAP
ncbi:MAG: YfhO family protein [Anaerolineae bacterium]|nr:YfhO family protein [Anaerolineae bacterium]